MNAHVMTIRSFATPVLAARQRRVYGLSRLPPLSISTRRTGPRWEGEGEGERERERGREREREREGEKDRDRDRGR